MAIDAIIQPLLKLEIFQGLKPLQITEIARRAYRVVYKPGDVILREHADGEAAKTRIEALLAGTLGAERLTHTM